MSDLIERLRDGCVLRPKRWSGDTHDDLGGSIDEAATDALLREAAAALEAAREDADRWRWLRDKRTRAELEIVLHDEGPELDAAIDQARGKGVP